MNKPGVSREAWALLSFTTRYDESVSQHLRMPGGDRQAFTRAGFVSPLLDQLTILTKPTIQTHQTRLKGVRNILHPSLTLT